MLRSILTAVLCLTAVGGDALVTAARRDIFKAVLDNGTHAIIGGLTWTIACLQRKVSPPASEIFWQAALCSLLASIIDIDHFIAAKSLHLQKARSLEGRPVFHCSTLLLAPVLLLGAGRWPGPALLVLAAVFSHHTRDAQRRGYWLWPLGSTPALPRVPSLLLMAVTPYLIAYSWDMSTRKRQDTDYTFVV